MDCAEEVALLRQRVGGHLGVTELAFDVGRGKLTVTHDPSLITADQICVLVTKAGMTPEAWSAMSPARNVLLRNARMLLTALSGLVLTVAHALSFNGWHDSLWAWLSHEHGGGQSPLVITCYVLAIALGFGPALPKLLASVRALRADMTVLMAVSLAGALYLKEYSEGGTLAFLFSLSVALEGWSLRQAQSSVAALLDQTPAEAAVLHHDHEHRTPVDRIPVGARVRIRPGETVPCDGVVDAGESAVDQAIITGEPVPVPKRAGDRVFAGTLNGLGVLEVRTTSAAADTTLARIVRMVEGAPHRRAPSEQFVERFARIYSPAILSLALAVAMVPPLVTGANAAQWFYQGMVILLISCPCALVISTPVTIVSALSSAARRGVLVKGGAFLEQAAKLRAVAFDKTGVLTGGKPQVSTFQPLNGAPPEQVLRCLAGLEVHSEHPLASAMVAYAREKGIEPDAADRFQARCGLGAEAEIGAQPFWAGNWRLCQEKHLGRTDIAGHLEKLEEGRHTAVLCGTDCDVWALIALTDPIRDNARQTVAELRRLGVEQIALLTGDNRLTAAGVAREVGIDCVHWEQLPDQKCAVIQQMKRDHGVVAMVGGGVNDAQALAAASIGIALAGRSTDVALETADVVLSAGDLRGIPFLLRHARRAGAVIRQNVCIAIGLKAVFLAMALTGHAGMWMAIAADMGATLLVTLNGLRLLRPTRAG